MKVKYAFGAKLPLELDVVLMIRVLVYKKKNYDTSQYQDTELT